MLTQNQQAPIHFPILSPLLPSTSADHPPPPPYLGQGGTTHPSTPFDLKSSVATSWPQDGFLTTSQAITMNPRSQWSLFEFGKRLNCERICIQKFSCCSGERGHFVLVCLMGRLQKQTQEDQWTVCSQRSTQPHPSWTQPELHHLDTVC